MKRTKMFLLLIVFFSAVTLAACGGGSGGGGEGGGGGGGPTSINIPETGQTTRYAAGDDGDLERGVEWPNPRFIVDGTGLCVTDNLTSLMWVRTPDSTQRTWQEALNYANDLTLCGYSDWRLPNRKELRSLINYEQANTLAWLNTRGFIIVPSSRMWYWSSSTYAGIYVGDTTYAWYVGMYDGIVEVEDKTLTIDVWPVRAGEGGAPADLPETGQTTCYNATGTAILCANTGQDGDIKAGVAWPSPRFTVDGTGLCITDNLTGLMWVRTPDSTTRTWAIALTYANGLSLCGYDDWRLPNVNELESLLNAEQANTATWLNAQGFSNVQAYYYWSSSTYAGGTAGGWGVAMGGGLVLAGNKSYSGYVWPVRAGQ